jgi:hypothetical protein
LTQEVTFLINNCITYLQDRNAHQFDIAVMACNHQRC